MQTLSSVASEWSTGSPVQTSTRLARLRGWQEQGLLASGESALLFAALSLANETNTLKVRVR